MYTFSHANNSFAHGLLLLLLLLLNAYCCMADNIAAGAVVHVYIYIYINLLNNAVCPIGL